MAKYKRAIRHTLLYQSAVFYEPRKKIKLETRKTRPLRDKEVLLKVRAAGVCHSDIHIMRGLIRTNGRRVLGHEIAGEIEQVGTGNRNLKEGQSAIVHYLNPCGKCRYCSGGESNMCESSRRPIYGITADGGYAQYCAVQAHNLVPFPTDISNEFAATLGCAGLTAFHAVNTVGRVKPGETVGIIGVGGVAMYAIQLAKLAGARVIAVGRNKSKLDMARNLGANRTIRASGESADVQLMSDALPEADVFLDLVTSDSSVAISSRNTVKGGRVVLVGLSKEQRPFDTWATVEKELTFTGSFGGTKEELKQVVGLAKAGKLQSVVTSRFTLIQLNQVLESLSRGRIVGRGCIIP